MEENQLLYSRIEGEGKPLLILHGFLGMSDNWKTLAGRYAEQGYQVHCLDLRNHGRSFHSQEFSQEVMVQDLIYYCKYYHLDKIAVIGHSMGGKLAMFLAVEYPDLVDKLIVADISVRAYPPHHQDILQALSAVDFSVQTDRTSIQQVISSYISDPGVVQFLMKNVHRVSADQLGYRMNLPVLIREYGQITIGMNADKKFTKPTLFIRGGKSKYIQEDDKRAIVEIFPDARFETIENAGHWLHAENPNQFFNFSIDYLKS